MSHRSLAQGELTAHRIEQFKRERLRGTWKAHRQQRRAKRIQPATVNRELDTLKSILSKAVEWGKLVDSPARGVKRLPVDNRRTRILSLDEQRRLLRACAGKLQGIVVLALITSARIGEILTLRWEQCEGGYLTFFKTKNGRARRIPISATMADVFSEQPALSPWVFTNPRTGKPYTTVAASFRRALERAGIQTRDVTPHTLRHTALSRMIEAGYDDYTVMAISGHSSTRMLRALHASDRGAEGSGAGVVQFVHKLSTRAGRGGEKGWWTAWGSNPRPPRCERGALPAELAARRTMCGWRRHADASPGFYTTALHRLSRHRPPRTRVTSACLTWVLYSRP